VVATIVKWGRQPGHREAETRAKEPFPGGACRRVCRGLRVARVEFCQLS
jgi:hypothetical protein